MIILVTLSSQIVLTLITPFSFFAGIAVLVAAGFFGYMLALLQRRVGLIVSSENVSRHPLIASYFISRK